MNKVLLGLLVGALLGAIDGGTAWFTPAVRSMMVGIVVGTYSSVYIASPLTIWLDERQAAKERAQKKQHGRVAATG